MKYALHILACVSVLMLSACKAPTSKVPEITEAELSQELGEQEKMLADIKAKGGSPKKWQNKRGGREQFDRVGTKVEKAGANLCKTLGLHLDGTCYFTFKLESSETVNAYADGEKIVVTTAMINFVESDEELALVMAHELAHNLLKHPDAAKTNAIAGGVVGLLVDVLAATQGIDTQAGFSKMGAQTGVLTYSRAFEAEADYVGLYIMANAGYNISKTPYFWRRFSIQNPDGIYGGQTHPSNPERFVALNKTVTEINYKRQKRIPLVPDFKPLD